MKLKECFKKGLFLTMAVSLLLTGCSTPTSAINENTVPIETQKNQAVTDTGAFAASDNTLLASLREKYGAAAADYSKDTMQIERNESIQFQLEFDVYKKEIEDWNDYFCIYQDADMKYPLTDCAINFDDESNMLTIEPPTFGVAEMAFSEGSDVDSSNLSGKYLEDEEFCDNWGNLGELYFVQKLDAKTGEELKTPLVTIIKVNTELKKAPKVTYSCNENGEAQISWAPVEGATDYLLFTVVKTEEGFDSYTNVFARTSETSWTAPKEVLDDGIIYSMNEQFRNFFTSEDDTEMGGMEDMNEDFFETMPEYVGVIAVNKNGSSPVSNLYSLKDYSKLLPNCFADYQNESEGFQLYQTAVDMLPAETSITMCDGSTSRRVIDYDFENAVLDKESSTTYLKIFGYASGTNLCEKYMVEVNEKTLDADLAALKERQDALKSKGGTMNKDVTIDEEEKPVTTPKPTEKAKPTKEPEASNKSEPTKEPEASNKSEPTKEPEASNKSEPTKNSENNLNTEVPVTANSALSEYIAIYLLNSAESINLSMFNESVNTNLVVDAFLEAQYQNPLVMGIQNAGYDSENRILYVAYDDSPEETSAKREAVKEKASEIVSQIITDDMSDVEKEMSINQYLCENAEYDDAALENAEQYEFKTVDDEFSDSFTPYGVLVNGVGVCASYAGAFKILADEAGLESMVITGYLDGNLPHAWNRIKLDDQWVSLDVTNNDNDIIQNALLNVSDPGVNNVLVEDEHFVIDEKLFDYSCDTDENEFYRYTDKYFDLDSITNELSAELEANGSAVLRTDYEIDDYEFQEIAQSVANQVNGNIKGYYWLGVIHLTK